MRARRPLALLGAVSVATALLLVVSAQSATRTLIVPLAVAPSCGSASSTAGTTVQLTAANLTPGTSPVTIGTPDGANGPGTAAGSVVVAADGSLDQTLVLPPLAGTGVYQVTVQNGALRSAVGYFSIPCPTLTAHPACGPADDGSGGHYALTLAGTAFGPPGPALPVHLTLDGAELPGSPAQVASDGTFSALVTPAYVAAGVHTLRAYETTADGSQPLVSVELRAATTTFTTPCATTGTQTTTQTAPTTSTGATGTSTVATTATTTTPTTPATLTIAPTCLAAATGTTPVQLSGTGFAPGALEVLIDGSVATDASAGSDGTFTAEAEIAAGSANHLIEARQGSQGATATLLVPCAAHASLTLDPPIGPPGFVTQASGSGFPPNVQVQLSWTVGLGELIVRTDADGAFRTPVVIFPQDETGPRELVAAPIVKGSFINVQAAFLCVPGSAQPPSFEVRS